MGNNAPIGVEHIVTVANSGRVVVEAGAAEIVRLVNAVLGVVGRHCCSLSCTLSVRQMFAVPRTSTHL